LDGRTVRFDRLRLAVGQHQQQPVSAGFLQQYRSPGLHCGISRWCLSRLTLQAQLPAHVSVNGRLAENRPSTTAVLLTLVTLAPSDWRNLMTIGCGLSYLGVPEVLCKINKYQYDEKYISETK
jgi:hypothetical protein